MTPSAILKIHLKTIILNKFEAQIKDDALALTSILIPNSLHIRIAYILA